MVSLEFKSIKKIGRAADFFLMYLFTITKKVHVAWQRTI